MTNRLAGAPLWADLMTTDVEKAKAFYQRLLGWEFTDTGEDYGHYVLVSAGGEEILGLMAKTPDTPAEMPDVWTVYLGTGDAQAALDKAAAEGGQAMMGPHEIPGEEGPQGTMGVLSDPAGAVVGVWQPGKRLGFELSEEPGRVAWVELLTKDFDGANRFYRDVFAMDLHDISEEGFRYATLGPVDAAALGIGDGQGFLPDGAPSHWRVYFSVGDADAAVATVRDLGGQVIDGPADSPHGRMATVADDQGAMFLVVGPNTGS